MLVLGPARSSRAHADCHVQADKNSGAAQATNAIEVMLAVTCLAVIVAS